MDNPARLPTSHAMGCFIDNFFQFPLGQWPGIIYDVIHFWPPFLLCIACIPPNPSGNPCRPRSMPAIAGRPGSVGRELFGYPYITLLFSRSAPAEILAARD